MVAYLSAISLPDFVIVLTAALETILVADIVLELVEIRMKFSFELLAASQTGRMDRLVKLAVPPNNRLLALGRHIRGCQATTEVLDMQLQHTVMRPRPLLRLRMLARTVHHESLKAGQT